jgi:cytoskeleton protein RodZ
MGEDRSDFGTKLRDARERKGVTLRQMANRTKISMTILEALERNDVTRLPGGIFSRSFVRTYAHEVGLNPDTAIQEFVAQFPQEAVSAGHLRTDQVEDTQLFESDRRMASSVLWILIVSIPLAGSVLYFSVSDRLSREPAGRVSGQEATSQESPRPADSVRSASTAGSTPSGGTSPRASGPGDSATPSRLLRTVAPAAPPARGSGAPTAAGSAASPAGNAAGSPAAKSTASQPAGAAASTPVASTSTAAGSPVPADDHLTIVLAARRPVWVSATADGQRAIGRLLQTGEQETVDIKRELTLTAGDAAAVKMTVNGAEARSLGKSGEVVTARVTLANFKDYLQSR